MIFSVDKSVKKQVRINALMDFPTNKKDLGDKKFPLIIYLHGAGEQKLSVEKMKNYSIRNEFNKDLGFAILTPHCPVGKIWEPDALNALIEEVVMFGHIDTKRIYLTGFSMGGRGCWDMATAYPDWFAGVVPISGYSCYLKAAQMRHVPCMVFHGTKDEAVPIMESLKMVSALNELGNCAILHRLKCGHHEISGVYNHKIIYEWMSSLKK